MLCMMMPLLIQCDFDLLALMVDDELMIEMMIVMVVAKNLRENDLCWPWLKTLFPLNHPYKLYFLRYYH